MKCTNRCIECAYTYICVYVYEYTYIHYMNIHVYISLYIYTCICIYLNLQNTADEMHEQVSIYNCIEYHCIFILFVISSRKIDLKRE
jgi:hypothetical protein